MILRILFCVMIGIGGMCSALAQNIGIGVDTPLTTLHVAGKLLTDSLMMPTGAAEGRFLRADSAGNGYWSSLLDSLPPFVETGYASAGSIPYRMAKSGSYVYLVDILDSQFRVFEVSGSNPNQVNSVEAGPQPIDIAADGDLLVVLENINDSLLVYDITNPDAPDKRGAIYFFSSPYACELSGDIAYILSLGFLATIDCSNPDAPVLLDTIEVGSSLGGMDVQENYVYVADPGSGDLKVIDISDPAMLELAGAVSLGPSSSVAVRGTTAYVVDSGDDDLRIVDVSNPAGPFVVDSIQFDSVASTVAVSDVFLVLANLSAATLDIFDIADPQAPELIYQAGGVTDVQHLLAEGTRVFALDVDNDKLHVFDITTPLITQDIYGNIQTFDQVFNGLVEIRSPNDHIKLTRPGAGSVYLSAGSLDVFEIATDTQEFMTIRWNGQVRIGTDTCCSASRLLVNGTIESLSGGFKFPDGTIQTTSAQLAGEPWFLDGNAGTGGTGFLGTTDNTSFSIGTNSLSRMRINGEGEVQIGSPSGPRSILTVRGYDHPTDGPVLTLIGNNDDQEESGRVRFLEGTAANNLRGGYIHFDGAADRFHIGVHNTSDDILANDVNAITIDRNTAFVGIGTENPEYPLHVEHPGTSGQTIVMVLEAAASNRPVLQFSENNSSIDLNDGMSIEYDGATSDNQIHINGIGGTPVMTIENLGGEVGIGTTEPTALLEVNASTVKKVGGGSWSGASDIRLKQDISSYTEGLASVRAIRPVRYRYNRLSGYDMTEEHIGVVAQELQAVAPYMVSTFEKNGDEYLEVDNSAMTYMLINAVKTLAARNEELEQQITALKALLPEAEISSGTE